MPDPAVQTWNHSRKGRIRGTVVSNKGEWLDIQLVDDHHLRYMAEANRGRVDEHGEVIRVRKAHLTEVEATS